MAHSARHCGQSRTRPKTSRWALALLTFTLTCSCTSNVEAEQRWSTFPLTMGCISERSDHPPAPAAATVASAIVDHLEDNRVRITLVFSASAPVPPRTVPGPYGGFFNAPGSLFYSVRLGDYADRNVVIINSPQAGRGWKADDMEGPNPHILESASSSGRAARLTLNLDSQPHLLGRGAFRPTVRVIVNGGNGAAAYARGQLITFYATQRCEVGTPIMKHEGERASTVPTTSRRPTSQTSQPNAGEDKLPGLQRDITFGQSCDNTERFVYGQDRSGGFYVCHTIGTSTSGVWDGPLGGQLTGVRAPGTSCPYRAGSTGPFAQSPNGEPMICTDNGWALGP